MRRPFQFRQQFVILGMAFVVGGSVNMASQGIKEPPPANTPFSLTIATKESTVRAGSPVLVEVKMENKSDHDLAVYRAVSGDLDQGGWVYKVSVRDTKGVEPPQTKFAQSVGVAGSGGYVSLRPEKTLTDRCNVAKLYDLSRPGNYTIQVERLDEQSKAFVKSNTITVTVTP